MFNDISDILDDENEPCGVCIEFPDVPKLSDEDSANEDDLGPPERLSGQQFLAKV